MGHGRVKLLLHVPFRKVEELLTLNGIEHTTFTSAFSSWQRIYGSDAVPDYLEELPPDAEDEFEELDNDDSELQ
jgi:hypothetical protein